MQAQDQFDVLILGAGLSGISAAWHLQAHCPGKSFAILESRAALGGTWDLFRYPGIRSDSDMFTLGFSFRPWKAAKAIADGETIRRYLQETASEFGISPHIRYRQRVVRAEWRSDQARWTLEVECGENKALRRYHCQFLHLCCGYYDYVQGHRPTFPQETRFGGRFVHPQHWPRDLDVRGKRIVVIGSGATAVTLVPNLVQQGAKVSLLQRSPTYVVSLPSRDVIADALRRWLPASTAHTLVRWKNVLLTMLTFQLSRRAPKAMAKIIHKNAQAALGPNVAADPHFSPRYAPWDQRLCVAPDGDLFTALREGAATIVTDQIAHFTETGVVLASGCELTADIVVTATGLEALPFGGLSFSLDGTPLDPASTYSYKGMMLSGVPNLAYTMGYTNASWTLKADLVSAYVCRLLNRLDTDGHRWCVPQPPDTRKIRAEPFIDLSAGYVLRALNRFPKQGHQWPWRLRQNYLLDLLSLRFGCLDDGVMRFAGRVSQKPQGAAANEIV